MFDQILRAMAGVLVVVGVVPDDLENTLNLVPNLAGWFWLQRTHHIHIRLLLRCANLCERSDKRIADRDLPVPLVQVSGLTYQQLLACGHAQDSGFSVAGGSAYAAWGGSLFLPIHLVDGCVVLLKDVRAIFSLELIRKVESTLHQFHSLVRPGSNRRRVQQARNQMSASGGALRSILASLLLMRLFLRLRRVRLLIGCFCHHQIG